MSFKIYCKIFTEINGKYFGRASIYTTLNIIFSCSEDKPHYNLYGTQALDSKDIYSWQPDVYSISESVIGSVIELLMISQEWPVR